MPIYCIIFCTIPGIYSIIRQKGYGWRCSGMENPPYMSKYNNSGDVCGGRWDEPQKPRELQFPEVDSKTRYRPLRKLIKIRGWPDSQILHTLLHAFPLHLSSVKAWQCVNFTRKKLFRKPQSDNKNWHIPVKRWQPGGIGGQKSPNSLKYGAKGVLHAMNY